MIMRWSLWVAVALLSFSLLQRRDLAAIIVRRG